MSMQTDLDERVLRLIKKETLPGAVIAARLSKTTSAINKAVSRMRERGIEIQSTEGGYVARSL